MPAGIWAKLADVALCFLEDLVSVLSSSHSKMAGSSISAFGVVVHGEAARPRRARGCAKSFVPAIVRGFHEFGA